MEVTPIDYLRAQLKRYAARHGYQSYCGRRLSALLDHLLTEWYDAMPDRVVAAAALQSPAMRRTELVQCYDTGKAQNDFATLASLLPHVLNLPKDDPSRPEMLHWCSLHGLGSISGTVPTLTLVALEDLANTAPQWSLVQFKALGNLGIGYRMAGRFYASYLINRMLVRYLHAFPSQGFESTVYYNFYLSARYLGKPRAAEHALRMSQQFLNEKLALSELASFTDRCTRQTPLAVLRPAFQQLWTTMGKLQCKLMGNILGGYAIALLQNGYPRGAMAVAQKALVEYYYVLELINQVELLALLAAASYRIGRDDVGDAFRERAEQSIPTGEIARLVAARIKEWSVQPEIAG